MERPKPIELTLEDRTGLIERIKSNMSTDDTELLIGLIDFNLWLQFSLHEKSISINRLQKLFGNKTEKRKKKKKSDSGSNEPENKADSSGAPDNNPVSDPSNTDGEDNSKALEPESTTNVRKYVPNNGRLGHEQYTGAEIIPIKAPFKPGDPCPEELCSGRLRMVKAGNIIKIVGQSFAKALHYEIETLRCNLCEKYFSGELPEHVSNDKYDSAFKSQLSVHRHYLGVPAYRLEGYQRFMGVPLPDSTQFEKIEEVANAAYPAFMHMEKMAANGRLAHGDDTKVKIKSIMKENRELEEKARKGMFTTGIISFNGEHTIHLFYSGRKHCGENMMVLLEKRDTNLPDLQYMCDALGSNMPPGLKAVLINCLVHGRRNFIDIEKYYPDECKVVIDAIAVIYKHEAEVKGQKLNDEERLEYHKTHSIRPMENLHAYMQKQLDEHLVEDNSSLGKAYRYMIKHWHKLTQFLRIPGAPLDNNILL